MSVTRTRVTIDIASDGTSSDWVELNSKFGDNNPRSFSGNLTSGDSIVLDLTNDEDPNTTLETYVRSDAYDTVNFGGTYIGGFRWARFTKTGSNGAAKIKLEL